MLIEFYIFFEIVTIILFLLAFFTHQEVLWALTLVLSGIMMFTSYVVEYPVYIYDATFNGYVPSTIIYSYPYLMGINFLFTALSLVFGMFDLFDKYGSKYVEPKKKEDAV